MLDARLMAHPNIAFNIQQHRERDENENDEELLSSMAKQHFPIYDARQRQLEAAEEADIGFSFSDDELGLGLTMMTSMTPAMTSSRCKY